MLQLVLGPMYSGKTCQVIRLARRYRAIGKNVIFVDHTSDTRNAPRKGHDQETRISSHDGVSEHCIFVEELEDLLQCKEYTEAEVVVIEEAQFFPDLLRFVPRESDVSGKDFIVSGLSGDFQRKAMGEILFLVPHAEHVHKLNGLCNMCKDGTLGSFTKRTVPCTDQVLVGGKNFYTCVCRKHLVSA
jgi:thymidine kinase